MKKPRMFLKAHTSVIASAAKLSLFEKKIASLPAAPRNDPSHLVPGYVALSIAIVAYLLMPALALAHGGMGPEEIGPPIVTSGLLGFVGYWVVMLWPSVKKKDDPGTKVNEQGRSTPQSSRRPHHPSIPVKRVPRLRKIEGSGQFSSDENVRRKASDG